MRLQIALAAILVSVVNHSSAEDTKDTQPVAESSENGERELTNVVRFFKAMFSGATSQLVFLLLGHREEVALLDHQSRAAQLHNTPLVLDARAVGLAVTMVVARCRDLSVWATPVV